MTEYWQCPCQLTCLFKIMTRAYSQLTAHTKTFIYPHPLHAQTSTNTLAAPVGHLTSRGRGWPLVKGPAQGQMLAPPVPCKREGRWGTTTAGGGCCCHGSGAAQSARFYDGISSTMRRKNTGKYGLLQWGWEKCHMFISCVYMYMSKERLKCQYNKQ